MLVLVTIGLAGYAFQQRQAATRARDTATTARNTAQSREVAIEADQVRGQNVGLAAQLSLAAYRIAPTAGARASLLESSGSPAEARLIDSLGVVQAVSLSPRHRLLAVAAADGTLRLWNVSHPNHPVPAGAPLVPANRQEPLYTVAFSPDGSLLAAAGAGRSVTLWNMRAPGRRTVSPGSASPESTVYSLAFSSAGRSWPRAAPTERSGSGTWPIPRTRKRWARHWPARGTTCSRSRSAPAAPYSPRAARTRPSGCGTWPTRRARGSWASRWPARPRR